MELALLVSIALNGGLAMGFLHYWWPVWAGNDLEPPRTYIAGVGLGIVIPFVTWVVLYGLLISPVLPPLQVVAAVIACCASAGLFTVLSYWTDSRHADRQELRQRRRGNGP